MAVDDEEAEGEETEDEVAKEEEGQDEDVFLAFRGLCAHFVKPGVTHTGSMDGAEDSSQPWQLERSGLADILFGEFKDGHTAILKS